MALRPMALAEGLLRWWYRRPFGGAVDRRLRRLGELRRQLRLARQLGSCGRDVSFQLPICISDPSQLHVGNQVAFAAFVHVWAKGGVHIGDRVMIASHVAITTVTHDYLAPVMWGTLQARPIRIEDDAWIGSHAVILPGTTIGRGAVVGAGSVVTRDVPPNAIVTGIPARVLRYRPGVVQAQE